ncbi:MAG TPA: hypothetical protein VGR27_08810 [Longimicrobiaceae bacterium]|nr:hypothetical protein [Longimicrobiaceae bacterium]
MLEHIDHLAETAAKAAAKAISNIKFDKVIVWEGGGNGASSTAGFLQNMARTLPPMMQVMTRVHGPARGRGRPQGGREGADVRTDRRPRGRRFRVR